MENTNILEVANLTKIYKLYSSPKDRLKESISITNKKYHKDFFALKNISFEIKKGESFGLIGKNGSGKSTLLKLITGVLTPTSGKIKSFGKIAALLELGAGFNPELTGIENIYLNGTLSGATKAEIDTKLTDIINFADIGDFINQPVKVYSSGMFARLAFSVAINIDPDILIVDEALSVGDIKFQQKCLRKMKTFQESNKTIIFVSHDITSIENLCNKALWLDNGTIASIGNSKEVCQKYFSKVASDGTNEANNIEYAKVSTSKESQWYEINNCDSFGDQGAKIESLLIDGSNFENGTIAFNGGEQISLSLRIRTFEEISKPIIGWILKDRLGNQIIGVNTEIYNQNVPSIPKNSIFFPNFQFTMPYLQSGEYTMDIAIADGTQNHHTHKHWIHEALVFKCNSINSKQNMGMILSLENLNFSCVME